MRTTYTWMAAALGVCLLAVMLVPACGQGDGEALPTSSSALSSDGSLGLASPVPQKDDDSSDEDSSGDLGDGELNDNGSRVRDLLFAVDACPGSLTIGTTVVNTTVETRFDCEPGCDDRFEHLTADQFCPFLVPGLPMRARGTNDAGVINGARVRIDDEIKVTGTISVGSTALPPGTEFTLSVIRFGDLKFVVAPGASIDSFAEGSTVRVEGVVPPLTAGGGLPTFGATEIQN